MISLAFLPLNLLTFLFLCGLGEGVGMTGSLKDKSGMPSVFKDDGCCSWVDLDGDFLGDPCLGGLGFDRAFLVSILFRLRSPNCSSSNDVAALSFKTWVVDKLLLVVKGPRFGLLVLSKDRLFDSNWLGLECARRLLLDGVFLLFDGEVRLRLSKAASLWLSSSKWYG